MTDKETRPQPQPKPEIERRSVSEVALAATPVAIALQPIIGAVADKYIGQKPKDVPPPPQEPPKD
jgi:hypothetical protein